MNNPWVFFFLFFISRSFVRMDYSEWMPGWICAWRLSPSLCVPSPSKYLFAALSVTGSLAIDPWTSFTVWICCCRWFFSKILLLFFHFCDWYFSYRHITFSEIWNDSRLLQLLFSAQFFVFLPVNYNLWLYTVWNRINSQHVSTDQRVTSAAVYTLDHKHIDFYFVFLPFSPLSFRPLFICLLSPLSSTSPFGWLFYLCLLHSHATLC